MAASTLSIVLPEPFKTYVEAQVEDGLYPSATILIQSLLEEQQQRDAATLEASISGALEGDRFEFTCEEIAQGNLIELFRSRLRERS